MSLVPSLTDAIAVTCPGVLVGVTDWCTHPADLDVTRLRGTTFAGDVLTRLGVDHCFASHPERYPRFNIESVPPVDLVVLPDEPYAFAADDGPEAFPGRRCALVSGRHLTWYGPSLAEAREILLRQLAGSAHEQ